MSTPDSDLFMSMLKNKGQVIKSLLDDLAVCDKNMQAFQKLEQLYKDTPDTVSAQAALTACAKSLRHLNEMNKRLLMVLLVYSSSDSFTSDTTKVLVNQMGRGEEALKEMLRQKMRGA